MSRITGTLHNCHNKDNPMFGITCEHFSTVILIHKINIQTT